MCEIVDLKISELTCKQRIPHDNREWCYKCRFVYSGPRPNGEVRWGDDH